MGCIIFAIRKPFRQPLRLTSIRGGNFYNKFILDLLNLTTFSYHIDSYGYSLDLNVVLCKRTRQCSFN